jgi:hypothetical protein
MKLVHPKLVPIPSPAAVAVTAVKNASVEPVAKKVKTTTADKGEEVPSVTKKAKTGEKKKKEKRVVDLKGMCSMQDMFVRQIALIRATNVKLDLVSYLAWQEYDDKAGADVVVRKFYKGLRIDEMKDMIRVLRAARGNKDKWLSLEKNNKAHYVALLCRFFADEKNVLSAVDLSSAVEKMNGTPAGSSTPSKLFN